MNLEDLQIIINNEIKHLHGKQLNEVPVLINLSESSMGARASTEVKYAGLGFDWEYGQFRIEPEKPLVRKGNALTDIKKVEQMEFGGQKFYGCPNCLHRITKDDYYCRYCGQKLR